MIRVCLRVEEDRDMKPENREPTCEDCFFRRAELCALPGNAPCPTFRPVVARDRLEVGPPPRRPSTRAVGAAA
jgi:hypothetical protein